MTSSTPNTSNSSHKLFLGCVSLINEWKRDYLRDTAKYIAYQPSKHSMRQTDFEKLKKIPQIANLIRQKKPITCELPGMYVVYDDTEYSVIKVKIPDAKRAEIVCHWPVEPRYVGPEEDTESSPPAKRKREENDERMDQTDALVESLSAENRHLREEVAKLEKKNVDLRAEFEKFKYEMELKQKRDKADIWHELNAMKQELRSHKT